MVALPLTAAHNLSGVATIRHGFFGRRGGVSSGLYDSLNVGIGSGDDPAHVSKNRARITASLGAQDMVSCYQVHGREVVTVTAPWAERPRADAMVTAIPGIALCILTADCVPVLFADAQAGIIGAAHSGWQGALAGVCNATIDAMTALGADPARIQAAIGPAIQQASYEVGPEFAQRFIADDSANATLFSPGIADRLHFDLTGYVARQLAGLGLVSVTAIPHDTCTMADAYFSNRRRNHAGEPDYGRNASVITLIGA